MWFSYFLLLGLIGFHFLLTTISYPKERHLWEEELTWNDNYYIRSFTDLYFDILYYLLLFPALGAEFMGGGA